jgi:hypothetical protein
METVQSIRCLRISRLCSKHGRVEAAPPDWSGGGGFTSNGHIPHAGQSLLRVTSP